MKKHTLISGKQLKTFSCLVGREVIFPIKGPDWPTAGHAFLGSDGGNGCDN